MATLDGLLRGPTRFSFVSKAAAADTFAVLDLTGSEAVSRPYEFEMLLATERLPREIQPEQLLMYPAKLTIRGMVGETPEGLYHGMLAAFDQLHQAGPLTFYRAVLAPRLQRLSLHRYSEVYLDKTLPQVLEAVLRQGGLGPGDYELKLTDTYQVKPYYCQYEETALNHLHRRMEWRGLYYYLRQEGDRDVVVITDNKTFHAEGRPALPYRPPSGPEGSPALQVLHEWNCRYRPLPKKVVVREYNYAKASLDIRGEAEVSANGVGEVWLYGEHATTTEGARTLARLRAEELSCRARAFTGETTATGLQAGYLLQVTEHFHEEFNGRFLVTAVRHRGSQAGLLTAGLGDRHGGERDDYYRATFDAIPAAVQFRPERVTARPRVHGFLPAFVDSEGSGQYAELDEHGRYKVQVPFDLTDKAAGKASTWVRKASQYAGKDHGLHAPLHKGTEVLLSFEDGDPDRLMIVGTAFNSEAPNIVNQSNQTQTVLHTAGGNRMQFEDRMGVEHVALSSPQSDSLMVIGSPLGTPSTSDDRPGSDGFTFTTSGNLTVQATDGSTTLQNDTLSISGTQTETVGRRNTTLGVPSDIGTEAMLYFPILSFWGTPTTTRTVYGVDNQSVYGKFSQTVIGKYGGTYVGAAGNMYVTVPGQVQVPMISSSGNMYIGCWGDTYIGKLGKTLVGEEEIIKFGNVSEFATAKKEVILSQMQSLGTKLQAVGQKIVSAVQSIRSTESKIETAEIEMTELGTRVSSTGMSVDETDTRMDATEVSVEDTGTAIRSGEIEMTTYGMTMLG